jgi:DNA-binding CsgD family transcriptional regulator
MEVASRVQLLGPDHAAVTSIISGGRTGQCLVLTGGPGTGRSTLLDAAAEAAAGWTVLRAPGDPDETAIAYGGLQRLLAPVLGEVAELPGWQRDAVLTAVEGRRTVRGRLALGLATLGLLREAARARPVLVLADDADRLDRESWQVLTFVARRLAGEPVSLLAAVAAGHPPTGLPTHRLARWDSETGRDLLAALVPGLPGDVAAALAELSGGNPAALTDLAGALTPDQRRGDAPPPVTLPPDSALVRAYRPLLAALPAATRRLLLVAAAGEDLRPSDLHAAAVTAGLHLAALAPAERAGLVSTAGPVVTFSEPVLRALTYHDAPLADRRAAHDLLARTLATRGRHLPALVHRAAATAGPDDDLARALTGAAAEGPPLAAAAALELAAGLATDPDTAAAALLDAARHAWTAGRRHRATLLLRRAGQGRPGGPLAARAECLGAEIELRGGSAATAGDALLRQAHRLAGHDAEAAVEALVLAGETRYRAGEHHRYQEIARAAEALRRGAETPALSFAFSHVAGLAAMFRGDHATAFPELRRAVALADQVSRPVTLTRAALAAVLIGDDDRARALAGRAVTLARTRGEEALVPHALELAAVADLAAGRYGAAAATATEGATLARATGQPRLAESLFGVLAVLAALVGDRDTCLLRIRAAGDTGPGQARALCEWALALLDLVHSRPQPAADRLRGLVAAPPGHGNLVLRVAATPHLVEAAWRCGEPVPADACAAFDGWTAGTGRPGWLALRARCRALRAADGRVAEEHFTEALRLHHADDAGFPRAHTELLFGRELRRRRRPGAARDHLRSAVETFRLLDAGPWADQADRELRAAGDHVDRAPAAADLPLTAQQERIARMVADGATNREIAAQMFLSPRTVDHHLRNVFVRLGVRSRTELARLMPAS